DRIKGWDGADTINGLGGPDDLFGGGGDDILNGGDGSDQIFPGAGADVIDGGAGSDWVHYFDSPGGVTIDLVNGTISGGDAEGDTITNIERIAGSEFDDVIYGHGTFKSIDGAGGD